jgi:hypothetical protein
MAATCPSSPITRYSACAPNGLGVAEHPVADLERGDAAAGAHDLVGELISQNLGIRPGQAGHQRPHDPGPAGPVVAVGAVYRRRVHLDQQLAVPGSGFVHLRDPDHLRRPIPGVHCCLHSRMLAAPRQPGLDSPRRQAPRTGGPLRQAICPPGRSQNVTGKAATT